MTPVCSEFQAALRTFVEDLLPAASFEELFDACGEDPVDVLHLVNFPHYRRHAGAVEAIRGCLQSGFAHADACPACQRVNLP